MRVVVLGAGITGLTVSYELQKNSLDYLVLEKEATLGGLCRSVSVNNFIFDYAGHFLHFCDPIVKNFVKRILKDNILKVKRNARIYTKYVEKKNFFIPYPFQANIKFLSSSIKEKSIKDLLYSYLFSEEKSSLNGNFYSWLIENFGNTITEIFFRPYNEKIWRRNLKEISNSWVRQFVPVPKIEEIFLNLIEDKELDYGYNVFFYYPKYDGIQSLVNALESYLCRNKILTSITLLKIDYLKKEIYFLRNNKIEKIKYDTLVSTIPIVELIKISNFPSYIKRMSKDLKYTGVLCFNLAVKNPIVKKIHWIYFPDKEITFYRVGFYNNVNKNLVPSDIYGSMYVEVSYDDKKGFDELVIYKKILNDLLKVGILKSLSQIIFYKLLKIPVGYVIYDYYRDKNLPLIHKFLNENQIYSIGRYGAWKYSYISENIKDAMDTVKKLLR